MYKYLSVKNNRLKVMVPFVSGQNIGLENTCQSLYALKSFFFPLREGSETIFSSLTRFKKDIVAKIFCSQSELSSQELARLIKLHEDATMYENKILMIKEKWKRNLDAYKFPKEIITTLKEGNNVGSIRLDPISNHDNEYMKLNDVIRCSFGVREHERTPEDSDHSLGSLSKDLRDLFKGLVINTID